MGCEGRLAADLTGEERDHQDTQVRIQLVVVASRFSSSSSSVAALCYASGPAATRGTRAFYHLCVAQPGDSCSLFPALLLGEEERDSQSGSASRLACHLHHGGRGQCTIDGREVCPDPQLMHLPGGESKL